MMETPDQDLVVRCLDGDAGAFASLVGRYQKTVFNAVLRMVRDPDDAEDITQSVFVKAYEHLASYKPGHKFFSWIYRMAMNETLNFLKSRKRLERLDNPETASSEKTPDQAAEENALREDMGETLMRLDVSHRAVVVLRHFHDLSYDEIAYVLDLPERLVKSRLFTARQQLKELLTAKGWGPS